MTSRSQQDERLLRDLGRLLAEVEERDLVEPSPLSKAVLDRIVDQVLAVTGAEAEPAEPELQQAEPRTDSVALPAPAGAKAFRKAWLRWGVPALGVAASIAFVLSRVGSHAESAKVGVAASAFNTPSGSPAESQPLSAQAPASVAERQAAAAPSAALAEPPSARSPWASETEGRAEPAASGEYELQLQITSFEDRAEADAYVERLRKRGHRAHVEASRVPNRGLWYRVRLGPFHSKDEALAYKAEFERKENLGALLVDPRAKPPLALEWPSSSASPRVRAPGKKKAQPPTAAEPRESEAAPKQRLDFGL